MALLAGLVGGPVSPVNAESTVSLKKQKQVQIDKTCRKSFRLRSGELQLTMDATLATWEGAKRSAEAAIADMKDALANPEQSVSIDALKQGALLQGRSMAASIEEEGARNVQEVKSFKKRFTKCFSTPKDKQAFDDAVAAVRAGFREMKDAKWRIHAVWLELSAANVSKAEEEIQKTLVDVIAAEPTFDMGMNRLGKMD
ncbi:MAG: hypothetical protein KDB83_05900 [Actinobacteria bacterium]|nr:hypothetical protein [Actinomycetota bacterium]